MRRLLLLFSVTLFIINVWGQTADKIIVKDTRDVNDGPDQFDQEVIFEFKRRSTLGIPGSGNYSGMMTFAPWKDDSGDASHQLNFNEGGIFYRTGQPSATSWDTWRQLIVTDENGNVGIGTTMPDVKLDIVGNIQLSNSDAKIGFGDFDGKFYYGIGRIGRDVRIVGYNGSERHIVFGFNDENENWTSSMTIENNGNVGIGTTSPLAAADIHGKIRALANSESVPSSGKGLELYFYEPTNASYINSYDRGSSTSYPLKFTALNYEFNGGNVGIGTTSPTYKLSVKGTIGCGEVIVEDVSGWADFVFEPDYNLMSLQELDSYIKENKHLPEIPTTEEVQENGISVGEMNAKLLQKIEELTLYTLQQQEVIEALKTENNEHKQNYAELKNEIEEIKKLIK